MEHPSPWSACIAVFLASLVLGLLWRHRRRQPNRPPPGPRPWPIIGNLNLIGPLPHRSIHALTKTYGHLMQLRFGSIPVVVASSAEAAKSILKTHDLTFASRPKTAAGKHTTYNYADILWSPYCPYWRQARKMCLTELFSVKRLESFKYIRIQEVNALLAGLFQSSSDGHLVVLKDHLSTAGLNVICRMVLGKKYADKDDSSIVTVTKEEFKKMLDELFLLNGVLNIGDYIPWLDCLDLQGYVKRMKVLGKKFDRFLENVLDEHNHRRQQEGDQFAPKDIVDVLLQFADNPKLDVKLHRDGVKAFTQDMLSGGTESSTVIVEWAISELLKRPDIFDKATEELDRVIGRERWVDEKDMHTLPYIEAIVKETMRLHPIAPLLVPRISREDSTIAGYDIPTGTIVLVNVWTIGRDPAIWDAPEEFRPERFLGSSIDVQGHHFELLPFGAGRRMCPGYSLGLKMIKAILANLVHGFNWRLPEGMTSEELSMEEIFGLSTPRKVRLEVVVEAKLPAHLYVV